MANLKFYKGSYADFYEKFLKVVDGKTALSADTNALYFTEPITGIIPEDLKNDVLSKSYGIWLGTNLLSSSYVANDRGNLKNVELVDGKPEKDAEGNLTGTTAGQYLKYTYQLSNGNEEEVWFPVSDLLIDSEFDTNNFKVDTTGKVSISNVQTSATTLDKTIRVAGLNGNIGQIANGTELTAGMTLYEILEKMFIQELWGNPSYQTANATLSIAKPTYSFKVGGTSMTSNRTVKYGTTIEVNVNIGSETYKTSANTVSGLDHGYSNSLDGPINSDTSITKSVSKTNNGGQHVYVLSVNNVDGFTGSVSGESSVSISGLTTKVGNVTVQANSVSNTYSVAADGISSGYVASNIGKLDANHTFNKLNAYSNDNLSATSTTAATSTYTLTSVYPCLINTDTDGNVTGTIRELTLITGNTITFSADEQINNKKWCFYYPNDRTITKFQIEQGAWADFNPTQYKITTNQNIEGYSFKFTKVESISANNTSAKYQITLSKNLNT